MGEFRLADRLSAMASEAVSVERRCVLAMATYDVSVPEIAAALDRPVREVKRPSKRN
jgi:DNA-directed RNA polymerase specialized sigma24 family protein